MARAMKAKKAKKPMKAKKAMKAKRVKKRKNNDRWQMKAQQTGNGRWQSGYHGKDWFLGPGGNWWKKVTSHVWH